MEVQSIHFSIDGDLTKLIVKIGDLLRKTQSERDIALASVKDWTTECTLSEVRIRELKEALHAATERACADSKAAACKVDALEVELSRTRTQYADYKLRAEANEHNLHQEVSRLLNELEASSL